MMENEEAEKNIPHYLSEGLLVKNPGHTRFAQFYLNNAKMSLLVAQHLHRLSTISEIIKIRRRASHPALKH